MSSELGGEPLLGLFERFAGLKLLVVEAEFSGWYFVELGLDLLSVVQDRQIGVLVKYAVETFRLFCARSQGYVKLSL